MIAATSQLDGAAAMSAASLICDDNPTQEEAKSIVLLSSYLNSGS